MNNEELVKLPNESLDDYRVRLCTNREVYGLSWADITALIDAHANPDKVTSPDFFRKWWPAFQDGMEYQLKKKLSSVDIIKEIEDKKLEVEKAKIQAADQRREYRNLLRAEARFDAVKAEIIKAVEDIGKTKPIEWLWTQPKQADGTREAILVISDSHVGLKAKNHWNSYDMDEFIKRIQRLIAKAIEYCKAHGVYKLKVFLLGDIINGLIHITTRINNQEDVIEQTMKAAEVIAEALTKLSTEIQIVEIFSARGNHDRVTPNKKEEIRSESFMDIIPWYLKARLKPINNIVLFDNEVDDETIITEVCGNLVYSVHGHRDGVESVVADLTLMFDKKPICVIMGHLHHHKETEVHGVEVIVNPSFSGVDDFSVNNRKTAKPAQKLIIFDPVEGRLCTYSIRLDITA